MAHGGQELRLHLRRLERLVAGGGQRAGRAGALDEEADRHADGGEQLAQLLVGLLELVAVELHRAEAAVAGHDRQADGARETVRGDRRRARRGGARHQRLGPHRLAGVRHAHRQVLERELADLRRVAAVRAVAPARDRRQLARVLVGQPQRADLPAEVGAERLEEQRRGLLDARGLREHAGDVVARAEQLLAARLLGDVLELDEELGRPAAVVGQRGGVDEHPARLALAGDDPALRLVGADLAGQHALEQPLAHAPLLGMDGLGERALEQLGLGAPQQLAERGVDEAEAPVGADHRHPGRRVVERVHEALRRLGHADRAGAVRLAGEVGEGELDDVQRLFAAELLGGGVAQQRAALEVVRGDRDGRGLEQAAQALQRLELGAQLELDPRGLRELLEHRGLPALPVARLDVGDGQHPDRAAGERERDAGVGEHLAGLDGREALGPLVLAGVVDDDRTRRAHQARQLSGADVGQRLLLGAGHHRHRRVEHVRGQRGEPLEDGVLPLARAGHGGPIGSPSHRVEGT